MDIKSKDWYIYIDKVRTDYVVVENLQQFLNNDPPRLHPDHPDYVLYWSKETKKCIEGIWGKEFGKYRYMPGNLYFFGNYGIIQHTKNKESVYMKPLIFDLMWDFAYDSMVERGFSGFNKDKKYSCNLLLQEYYEGNIQFDELPPSTIYNGKPKIYREARTYIELLHDKNLGKPLFENETQDGIILGSRGGGKSYFSAIAEIEYRFVFCNATSYDSYVKGLSTGITCEQCVGSEDEDKSSELLQKFKDSQDAKANLSNQNFIKWFGIWDENYPSPFYRKNKGNLKTRNKKNPYRHEYDKKEGGEFRPKGTGSKIFHVNYSSKKGDGDTAGSGGRYHFSNVEEVGLVKNYVKVRNHNEGTVKRGGRRFGVQKAQGTSGNIEYVQAAKQVFLNPKDYRVLAFKNQNGTEGKDGYTAKFLPYYMTLLQFKDKNGNTDYEKAINYVNKNREKAADASDSRVLRDHLMNFPCLTHEMWITDQGYYLPYDEAQVRERQLMSNSMWRDLATCVNLKWNDEHVNGVEIEVLHNKEPIHQFPLPKKIEDPSGCIVIYEYPEYSKEGGIYEDMYIFAHDPYVEEDVNRGGSLGVTYVLKNPKYINLGYTGNIIVASYIGKPLEGLEKYYENLEKLLALYGNPPQGLWYEKNRGEYCRNYFIRKNKLHLLCLTPQYSQGSNIYQKHIVSTGFLVGNRIGKLNLLKLTRDWFLEHTQQPNEKEPKINILNIPCLFLIRQVMQFNLLDNFDAVSAFLGAILGLREMESAEIDKLEDKKNINIFKNLLGNPKVFRQYDTIKAN